MRAISVLWVTGAPGVGKSTVGWGLYARARADGAAVAYLDIDQVGILLPAPSDDPDRHRLHAENFLEVLDTFRRYGARQLIVSGVVDPQHGLAPYLPDTLELTLVRLRCAPEELRRRFLGRGSPTELLTQLGDVARAYDDQAIGETLDSTDLSADAVVRQLADRIRHAPPAPPQPVSLPGGPTPREPMPVLLLCGPTAVGKSTVGWQVLQQLHGRGIPTAFVDADQLGFYRSDHAPKIKAGNLTRVWRRYRDAGARALVTVARGLPPDYLRALSGDHVTTVALTASRDTLAHRIAQRARGEGVRLAGDSLLGATPAHQTDLLTRAGNEATTLRPTETVHTDDTSPADLATQLTDLLLTHPAPTP